MPGRFERDKSHLCGKEENPGGGRGSPVTVQTSETVSPGHSGSLPVLILPARACSPGWKVYESWLILRVLTLPFMPWLEPARL